MLKGVNVKKCNCNKEYAKINLEKNLKKRFRTRNFLSYKRWK